MKTDEIVVFFATNRNLEVQSPVSESLPKYETSKFGIHPDDFRIGMADVQFQINPTVIEECLNDNGTVRSWKLEQESISADGLYTTAGSRVIFPKLLKCLQPDIDAKSNSHIDGDGDTFGSEVRKSALLFIHGFNNSFEESIITAAKISRLYSSRHHKLIPIVFCWPSDDHFSVRAYWDDRTDAEISGGAVARLLASFSQYFISLNRTYQCTSSAYLVAHSMGAYVLRHAMRRLQELRYPVIPMFDVVILAAPDVDGDSLETPEKLQSLSRLTRQVVVYVNKHDKALNVAQPMHNDTPRMGVFGPGSGASQRLTIPISTIECHRADFNHDDSVKHWYYHESISVVKDIKAVIEGTDPDVISFRKSVIGRSNVYRLEPPTNYRNRPGTQPQPAEDRGP